MEIIKAEKLAKQLMKENGVNYDIRFSNRYTTRFGSCNWRLGIITLSSKLVEMNNENAVKDVILHEIAHALTPKEGHNKVWKKVAMEIGCNGKRCYERNEVITPERKEYVYECPNCKKRMVMHKKIYTLACKSCCEKFSNGKYDRKFIIKLLDNR